MPAKNSSLMVNSLEKGIKTSDHFRMKPSKAE